MNRRPIGVFDSGIGGLTVVRELMHQLPRESLIYFGDTARVPYGNKSPETVRRYGREILAFLLSRDVKLVVVACNTVSAHALEHLREASPVKVEGVIEPGARAAVGASRGGRIGVIGTAGTVASGAYARAIEAVNGKAQVTAQACPLFVPLVEEGWLDHGATRLIAEEYLAPLRAHAIDTLVLGCTHYPLLRPLISEVMGTNVTLIDSAEATADETARVLAEKGLLTDAQHGAHRFVASDDPAQFLRLGQRFLGAEIERVETVTLG